MLSPPTNGNETLEISDTTYRSSDDTEIHLAAKVVREENPTSALGCLGTFLSEAKLGFFQTNDWTGKVVDFHQSFCVNASWPVKIIKIVLFSLCVSFFIYSFVESDYPGFDWAFMTIWAWFLAVIYFTLSLVVSFQKNGGSNLVLSTIIKATWALYSLVVTSQLMISIAFWPVFFLFSSKSPSDITLLIAVSHFVIFVFVFVDGMIINRTPIRLKHWLLVLVFTLSYTIYGIIHAFFVQFNPHTDEYESVYGVLDWKNDPLRAIMVMGGMSFLFSPALFLLIWLLSLHMRRYTCGTE